MRRTIVIGDIHGCFDELQTLLDAAAPASDDRIIALGDIVDRGPDSEKVLAFFRDTPTAVSIMGNPVAHGTGTCSCLIRDCERLGATICDKAMAECEAVFAELATAPDWESQPETKRIARSGQRVQQRPEKHARLYISPCLTHLRVAETLGP